MSTLTPMMKQYRQIKAQAPDAILLFRLGDFYEMFGEDAKKAAPILEIALTARQTTPMCGIPYHAAAAYIGKLVREGIKVAICDQVEEASQAKGIVKREITRIITPGTMLEEEYLEKGANNYLAAVARLGKVYGLAFLDISTGEFRLTEMAKAELILDEICRIKPGELLLCPSLHQELKQLPAGWLLNSGAVSVLEDWRFDYELSYEALKNQFGTASLDGFGCASFLPAVSAAGAIVEYVRDNLKTKAEHIRALQVYNPEDYMLLDAATRSSLEVVDPMRGISYETTLFGVLKRTVTPMGTRNLRSWLLRPLLNPETINSRHEAVSDLLAHREALSSIRELLKGIRDLQRLIGRIVSGNPNARDLVAVRDSLARFPGMREELNKLETTLWKELGKGLLDFSELVAELSQGLNDSPPIALKDGGMIKAGFSKELDELHRLAREGKGWIAAFQQKQIVRTGIKSLKVRYNKVFGYFIEVTKANLALVPEDYVRKQTLVNAERFITEDLKEYEQKVLGAQEKAAELEYKLFEQLRQKVREDGPRIQKAAEALAVIDTLCSLAQVALEYDYVRPQMSPDCILEIEEGRHPVVESALPGTKFVGNDTSLDNDLNQIHIITGPNMAGKSTYIRQVALIVLMAQAGSFVPANKAKIGCVDRIFARVGASDELSRGQSTFMVEMTETANILNHVTDRSLVILDEIGRGTSTFDGISIAWAVAEFIHNNRTRKARTLFATHYHELTELELSLPGVKNYNVAVREWNDRVIFLHKVIPGGTDKSYGIQVAKLAGLPGAVVERARQILAGLEEGTLSEQGTPKFAPEANRPYDIARQLTLFGLETHPILEELENINLEHMTPFEAMQRLKELRELL